MEDPLRALEVVNGNFLSGSKIGALRLYSVCHPTRVDRVCRDKTPAYVDENHLPT